MYKIFDIEKWDFIYLMTQHKNVAAFDVTTNTTINRKISDPIAEIANRSTQDQ